MKVKAITTVTEIVRDMVVILPAVNHQAIIEMKLTVNSFILRFNLKT